MSCCEYGTCKVWKTAAVLVGTLLSPTVFRAKNKNDIISTLCRYNALITCWGEWGHWESILQKLAANVWNSRCFLVCVRALTPPHPPNMWRPISSLQSDFPPAACCWFNKSWKGLSSCELVCILQGPNEWGDLSESGLAECRRDQGFGCGWR